MLGRLFNLTLAALLVTGCATVQSKPVKVGADFDEHVAPGLTYFLPKRMMKLTIVRSPIEEEKVRKTRDAKKAALEAAVSAREAAKTELTAAQAGLAGITSVPDTGQAGRAAALAKAAERVVKAEGDLAAAKAAEEAAAAALATAQANLEQVLAAGDAKCIYTAKLELLPAQPDPDYRFVARLAHNWFRDDTVKLGVNTSGLLTSANVVAVDRTGDIIVEAAGAFAGIKAGGIKAMGGLTPKVETCLAGQVMDIFDPMAVQEDYPAPGGYPFTVKVEPMGARPLAGLASRVDLRASQLNRSKVGALFYRTPLPVKVVLSRTDAGVPTPIDASIVMLPQAGPVTYLPMNSSMFVKTVSDVTFSDGMVTAWSTDRPSEALEVVRLPLKVLTAVIEVPAQLLSLKVDYSTKDQAMVDAQANEIIVRQRLAGLKACLDVAERDGTDPGACLPAK